MTGTAYAAAVLLTTSAGAPGRGERLWLLQHERERLGVVRGLVCLRIVQVLCEDDLAPPRTGSDKVLRGGDWYNHDCRYFRAAHRFFYSPSSMCNDQGFRCARGL